MKLRLEIEQKNLEKINIFKYSNNKNNGYYWNIFKYCNNNLFKPYIKQWASIVKVLQLF